MNATRVEQAISDLVERPFDPLEFPHAFLNAFGDKGADSNSAPSPPSKPCTDGIHRSDDILIKVTAPGGASNGIDDLRESKPAQVRQRRPKFILATDGRTVEAQNLSTGETVNCDFADLRGMSDFFLPLVGLTTDEQFEETSVDARAASSLDLLRGALERDNPDWETDDRRHDMNHFLARLIFCYFAECTGIFPGEGLFTRTVSRISRPDGEDTHEVIHHIFASMNAGRRERGPEEPPDWTRRFPRVPGELFSWPDEVPRFSTVSLKRLLLIGSLDWTKVTPEIFGSMIEAGADDEERSALGLHYTSVPNIMKVLNPLFLDDLRKNLDEAEEIPGKLLNLRKRMSNIRVFDPACGSGNFLVAAYGEMRAIEALINERLGEAERRSDIPITNFRGIEIRDLPAEVARLALIISERQCDALHRVGTRGRNASFPMGGWNWIVRGNALRLDWISLCPPTGIGVKLKSNDLFGTTNGQVQIDFENKGGETYICGNPPYMGNKLQSVEQKKDLRGIFEGSTKGWKSLDYAAGWLMKAAEYGEKANAESAFVVTNSICQGQQVPLIWPAVFSTGHEIHFAHTSFKWSNSADQNAGVIVIVVGISNKQRQRKILYSSSSGGNISETVCRNINPYLVDGPNLVIKPRGEPLDDRAAMLFGNMPRDGGYLLISAEEKEREGSNDPIFMHHLKKFSGAADFIRGAERFCLWIEDEDFSEAMKSPAIARRLNSVKRVRSVSKAPSTRQFSRSPHRFAQFQGMAKHWTLIVPRVSSERRDYIPVGMLDADVIVGDSAFALYDAPLWNFSLIASRMHLVWISAVCGKLKSDFRYSNTLGWNTFPFPDLSDADKDVLTLCAEEILRVRSELIPATIADLYDPEKMPRDLRDAHARNDEVVEFSYIGKRFGSDHDRLSTLLELYATELRSSIRSQAGSLMEIGGM